MVPKRKKNLKSFSYRLLFYCVLPFFFFHVFVTISFQSRGNTSSSFCLRLHGFLVQRFRFISHPASEEIHCKAYFMCQGVSVLLKTKQKQQKNMCGSNIRKLTHLTSRLSSPECPLQRKLGPRPPCRTASRRHERVDTLPPRRRWRPAGPPGSPHVSRRRSCRSPGGLTPAAHNTDSANAIT